MSLMLVFGASMRALMTRVTIRTSTAGHLVATVVASRSASGVAARVHCLVQEGASLRQVGQAGAFSSWRRRSLTAPGGTISLVASLAKVA
jgi:hypothetical protein